MDVYNKIRKCDICNKNYSSYKSLWNHKKKFHNTNSIKEVNEVQILPININTVKSLTCELCNKNYSSYKSLWNHNKIFHNTTNKITNDKNLLKVNKIYKCKYCSKNYNLQQSKWSHEQKCKNIVKEINEKEVLKLKIQQIKEERELLEKKSDLNKIKEDINKINNNGTVNKQLINNIIEKNRKIEELNNIITFNQLSQVSVIEEKVVTRSLTLNDIVIISRSEDNYINATQLCQAGGKQFNDWFRLNSSKQLLNEAADDIDIPISQLVDIKKRNSGAFDYDTWIHPDLAIQLAQWISSKFALQVSRWIRTLFNDSYVEINKLLADKDKRIKLLENTYLKKHKRVDYPDKNVVYILTTEDHKKKRTYIIGKATNLKNRITSYNKTAEHEVVYYKSCKNEDDMNTCEYMVLNKLKEYKEKANRGATSNTKLDIS